MTRILLLTIALLAAPFVHAESLIENGDFENPGDPLKGWVTDYAWSKNSFYTGNKEQVSVVPDGTRKAVAKLGDAGDAGVKMECRAFPLEPGFNYICNLDVKGGGYRIYFAGYQWMPGIRPHEKPELGELRLIYKSKALNSSSDAWRKEKLELPGVALSSAALAQLGKVRFLTLYIWMVKPGAVDNVTITKVADPAMKF